jgi:hypothetical protein
MLRGRWKIGTLGIPLLRNKTMATAAGVSDLGEARRSNARRFAEIVVRSSSKLNWSRLTDWRSNAA